MVVAGQPFLGENLRDLFLIGVGIDLALVKTAFDVVALCLLGKDHRKTIPVGTDRGERDAACLGSENEIDLRQIEQLCKLVGNVCHQLAVDPVVQKPVDFHDIAGQNLAFL